MLFHCLHLTFNLTLLSFCHLAQLFFLSLSPPSLCYKPPLPCLFDSISPFTSLSLAAFFAFPSQFSPSSPSISLSTGVSSRLCRVET